LTTRIELLRKATPVIKSFMDSVFLKNNSYEEFTGDDVMKQPYKKSDICYVCISTTNRAISQIPIRVYQKTGQKYKMLPMEDPWQKLFEKPNRLMDRYSFIEAIIGYLMLDGDVFIVPFPPGHLNPPSLWVVRKKFMGPIKDKDSGQLVGWNYDVKGVIYDSFGGTIVSERSIPLRVEEVSHVYFWNPEDPIMGQAPSEAGRMSILVDYKASRYTSNFFDEGAQPGGVLATDRTLTDKQFNRILNQFETKHGGYKKAHRVTLLENGLKYTQAGLSQKDMEFPKLRDLSARRIMQIYGMKEAIISETKTINRSTGDVEKAEWWESTNLPMMRMVCSALNSTLFPDSDLRCQFDITQIEALRKALRDKVDTGYKLWQMGFTSDELNDRLDLGFASKPWRRVWYMPVNLTPVNPDGTIDTLAPSNSQLPGSEPPKYIDTEFEEVKLLVSKTTEDRKVSIWNNIIHQSTPLEEAFTKKVSRVFFDMRKRTLELLYKKQLVNGVVKDPNDIEDDLYLPELSSLEKGVDLLYKQALLIGIKLVFEETGFEASADLSDPESITYLLNKKVKIRGIVQTVKTQIQRELADSYKLGESIDQAADRIRSVFDIAKSRARTIARTEMMGSANEGRYLAISRSGFKEKQWFTALDERVRPQHQAMHGKRIKVSDLWIMPDGSVLRHPGDYEGPASQIINCRCVELVFSGSSE